MVRKFAKPQLLEQSESSIPALGLWNAFDLQAEHDVLNGGPPRQ